MNEVQPLFQVKLLTDDIFFNWEMKTKKWMSNRRGGGVGVLLATILAGK